jgi:hypothetical protein
VRPRDAINGAREAWRREQEVLRKVGDRAWLDGWAERQLDEGMVAADELTPEAIRDAIDRKIEGKIAELCEERRRRPEAFPVDAERLARLVTDLLRQLGGFEIDLPPAGQPNRHFPFSLIARRIATGTATDTRIGVLCLASTSAKTTTATLRWLIVMADRFQRVLLITDERRRLVFGRQASPKGKQYYDALRNGKRADFQHVELTFDEYAQLDAVVSLARSGDLEIELAGARPRVVTAAEVTESHRRQGRYHALSITRHLLAENSPQPSDDRRTEDPSELVAEQPQSGISVAP